jgi:hypothetical protein
MRDPTLETMEDIQLNSQSFSNLWDASMLSWHLFAGWTVDFYPVMTNWYSLRLQVQKERSIGYNWDCQQTSPTGISPLMGTFVTAWSDLEVLMTSRTKPLKRVTKNGRDCSRGFVASETLNVGIHQKLCNEAVVSYLNYSQILLLPFTFDPFAAPGYFTCPFFFIPTTKQVQPAPKNHPELIIFLVLTPTALLIPMLLPHLNSYVHPLHHIVTYIIHTLTKSG